MDKAKLKRAESIARLAMLVTAVVLFYLAYQAESLVGGVFALAGTGTVYALTYYVACNALAPDIEKYVGETFYVQDGEGFEPHTPTGRTDDAEVNERVRTYVKCKEALGKLIGLLAFIVVIAIVFGIFQLFK